MLDRTLEVLGIKIESKWRMIGGDVNVNIIFNYNGREHSLYQSESIENSKVVKENQENYKASYLTKFVDQKMELKKQASFAVQSETVNIKQKRRIMYD